MKRAGASSQESGAWSPNNNAQRPQDSLSESRSSKRMVPASPLFNVATWQIYDIHLEKEEQCLAK